MSDDGDITGILHRVRDGDSEAQNILMDAVYPELQRMATRIFRTEGPGHTLEPTALIGDVWLRIVHDRTIEWRNRRHFYKVAVNTMRQALVDYARASQARRPPHPRERLLLEDVVLCSEDRFTEILDVHEALEHLGRHHAHAAHVVELRYYGGYKIDEIAEILEIAPGSVNSTHEFAMAWLEAFLDGAALD